MTMLKRMSAILLVAALGCVAGSHALRAQAPAANTAVQAPAGAAVKGPRPGQFKFPPLEFKAPKAASSARSCPNGLVVYIAEDTRSRGSRRRCCPRDHRRRRRDGARARVETDGLPRDWPQRGGGGAGGSRSFLEPPGKLGVQALTGSIVRSGGTTSMTAEQLNERMDFLAGSVTATSLAIHVRHVDEGLKIWLDLLNNPAFPEDRLQREKQGMLPGIRNRNRNISTVASRTFQRLVYGDASPIVAEPTEATISSITATTSWRAQEVLGANNAILVVSGDFKKAEMLQKLEATFGKCGPPRRPCRRGRRASRRRSRACTWWQPQGITPNQGIIQIGHIGLMRDDPTTRPWT